MKLITKSILNKLPKLYSTDNIPSDQKKVICKFFCPWNAWTWYVIEGDVQEDGDILFFGYVVGQDSELGYFTLKELASVRGSWGAGIERDLYFKETTLGKIIAEEKRPEDIEDYFAGYED